MGSRRATAKRVFGEISQLPSRRFRARYTGPDGNRHSAPVTFVARIDAEGWLVGQERLISRGEWRPLARQVRDAPLLMGEYAALVVVRRRLRPATAALYAKLLRLTILPTWANRALDDITAAEISTWYAGLQATPTQQANAYGLLKSIFKEAIEEGIRPCTVPETPVGQTWGNVALLATTTLNADTPHSEATPRSAECHQPDGRVHLDAHDDDRRHGTRPARSG